MKLFSITFLLGICSIFIFKQIPNFYGLGTFLLTSLILNTLFPKRITQILFGIILGCCWVMLFSAMQLSYQLPKSLEGKTISIEGFLDSLPKHTDLGFKFLFKTTKFNYKKRKKLLQLHWYANTLQKEIKPGELWHLTVRLKRIHGFANPGCFDFEKWAFQNGIVAQGYVLDGYFIKNKKLNNFILRLRYDLLKKIEKLDSDLRRNIKITDILSHSKTLNNSIENLLPALLIGDRNQVSQQQWDVLQKTETNHLISIAGLHIGLLATFSYLIIGFLWKQIPKLCLLIPAQIVASFFSLTFAFSYAALAGFSLPTKRAITMLTVVLMSKILKRNIISWDSFCAALLTVLILFPLSVLSASFWMSFGCVAILIYSVFGRKRKKSHWRHYFNAQWIIFLGLSPLVLWFFHQFSIISILANGIAVPYFSFIVMPVVFISLLGLFLNLKLAILGIYLTLKSLNILMIVLSYLSQINGFKIFLISFWQLIFSIIAVLLLLAPKGFPAKYLSFFFFLPIIAWHVKKPKEGEVWLHLLDVGQGLSVVIQTKQHVLLYDTGPKFSPIFDAGSAVILPFLAHDSIKKLDAIIISHGDTDHIGGLNSVLNNMPIKELFTSFLELKHAKRCYRGQSWYWDGVAFRILWPPKNQSYEGNNSSCVLLIKTAHQSILLTGDIEKPVEKLISKGSSQKVSTDILIAPHHGSRTSSSQRFIHYFHPKFVLFPAGYRNRFHFPSVVVERRYQKIGSKMYNTAETGAIVFKLNEKKLEPKLYRQQHHYIWNVETRFIASKKPELTSKPPD